MSHYPPGHRRTGTRPDDSLSVRRHPPDLFPWIVYVVSMVVLVAVAVILSAALSDGWGYWALTLVGAAVIGTVISLAVVPALRKR